MGLSYRVVQAERALLHVGATSMKGRKIVPGLAAGFMTTIACWVSGQFFGVMIPGEVGAALSGLLAIIVSVAVPDAIEADE